MQAITDGMMFKILLVGDGTDRDRLEELASHSSGSIQLIDSVPYEEVPRFLAVSHVGVLPFPDEEKFRVSSPIKLFEYMAAGMPILATRVVCHTDVAGEGNFVFWAQGAAEEDLLAGLKRVWQARQDLPHMGNEAELASRSWTWKASAENLADALVFGMGKANRLHRDQQSDAIAFE